MSATIKAKECGEFLSESSPRMRRVALHLESRLEEVRPIFRDPFQKHDFEIVELLDPKTGAVVKRGKLYRFEYGIETNSMREVEIFTTNAVRKEAGIIWERFGPDVASLFDQMGSNVPSNSLVETKRFTLPETA